MRWLALLLLWALPAFGATLYCSPSGGGSGADFNNLCTLPDTTGFTRGNTYIIVEGSYGSKTLSTATSGSTTITIKKASAADSAVAGYASTLHDAVASFGEITVATQYWIVDGVTRTETAAWGAPTAYGISASGISADSSEGHDADNSTFQYIDIGPAYTTTFSSGWGVVIRLVYDQTNITFRRCAIHNGVGTLFQGAGADNITFEYCDIGPGWGKEALRGGNGSISSGWIIRYNRFWNASQTDPEDPTSGITAEIGIWDWTGTASGTEIYGNWFYNQYSGGRNAVIVVGGDNSGWAGDGSNGTKVYNNTFAGFPEDSVFGEVDLNGSSTEAKNNLAYDINGTFTVNATTTSNNSKETVNPFVNYGTQDLHLSAALAGTTITSYDTDRDGVTRGADGTWDIGAYEYDSGGLDAPTNFRLISIAGLVAGIAALLAGLQQVWMLRVAR